MLSQIYAQLGDREPRQLGYQLQREERKAVDTALQKCHGSYGIQLGSEQNWLSTPIIRRSFTVTAEPAPGYDLVSCFNALPFAENSVDVIFLPHVLEFCSHPAEVLAEAARILTPSGNLLILCFNLTSLWGVRRLMSWGQNKKQPPWNGRFYTKLQLQWWLHEAELSLTNSLCLFFRPPLDAKHDLSKWQSMELMGRFCWPAFGASCLYVATKRVLPLLPIKPIWQEEKLRPVAGLTPAAHRLEQPQDVTCPIQKNH